MEKTKEQLAKEYAHIGGLDGVGGEDYEDDLRIAFTAGYDECEKNMIDKACEWLRNNMYHETTMIDCIAYRGDCNKHDMIDQLRKAMTDKTE